MPRVWIHSTTPGARSLVASPRRSAPAVCRSEGTKPNHWFLWPAAVTLALLLTLIPAGAAWAQVVHGTVLDAASGAPIPMADVALLATDGSIVGRQVTDEDGRFFIRAPAAGSYWLRARRIGYASSMTDSFALETGQDTVTELRLLPSPILLDPLEAVGERSRVPRLVREGFYKRQAKGFGYFRTPEDLEALRPVFLEDLFWGMGSVQMRGGTVVTLRFFRPCPLSVAIDGILVLSSAPWTELVHVNDIEAIEVYPSPAGVPVWLSGPVSRCGAIVIWTKGHLP